MSNRLALVMVLQAGCLAASLAACLSGPPAEVASSGPAPREGVRSEACASCHEDHYQLWKDGGHAAIPCEDCHGPAGDHILPGADPRPSMDLPGSADLCLSCHGGPPGTFRDGVPQAGSLEAHLRFVSEKHVVKTDVTKTRGRCVFCHDPHSLE